MVAISPLEESKVLAIVATAGQGEMPKSAVKFWQAIQGDLTVGAPYESLCFKRLVI